MDRGTFFLIVVKVMFGGMFLNITIWWLSQDSWVLSFSQVARKENTLALCAAKEVKLPWQWRNSVIWHGCQTLPFTGALWLVFLLLWKWIISVLQTSWETPASQSELCGWSVCPLSEIRLSAWRTYCLWRRKCLLLRLPGVCTTRDTGRALMIWTICMLK